MTHYHTIERLCNELGDTINVWEGVWQGVMVNASLALIPVWCFVHVKLTNKVQVHCAWLECKIIK